MTHTHGGNIYSGDYLLDFSANVNPLGIPRAVTEAACEGVRLSTAYPDPDQRELKAAIAAREETDPRFIICGNGAAELIYMICDALRPKKALLISPGFAEYELALAKNGCEIRYYPCREENGFRLLPDYTDHLTQDLDIAFLCNPNNPTGALTDPALLERSVRICRERRILFVVDECFLGLTDCGRMLSVKPEVPGDPYLFVLKAFTKLYGIAGLRLGYGLCSNAALLEEMRRTVQPWNVSVPAQKAGIAALKETSFEQDTRELISRERAWLRSELERLGLACFEPAANFIFFRGPVSLGEECRKRRILIRDCSNYEGLEKGFWRVAVRTREENRMLVRVLEEILWQDRS